jgi:hypothetical protein
MNLIQRNLISATCYIAAGLLAPAKAPAQRSATIKIYPERAKDTIPKEIYGHFAEHLGRLEYVKGLFYVPDDFDQFHPSGLDKVESIPGLKFGEDHLSGLKSPGKTAKCREIHRHPRPPGP